MKILLSLASAVLLIVITLNSKYFDEESVYEYSFVNRLNITNIDNVSIETDVSYFLPLGVDRVLVGNDPVSYVNRKLSLSNITLPPNSQVQKNISVNGGLSYPSLADDLYSEFEGMDVSPSDLVDHRVENDLAGISQLFLYLDEAMYYSGFQREALSMDELIKLMRGDCTEYTLISLNVLLNSGFEKVIPVEGIYLPSSKKLLSLSNFHAWLMVSIEGEWMIVDPLFRRVEKLSGKYIPLKIMEEQEGLVIASATKGRLGI
jgi:hypothetical protein